MGAFDGTEVWELLHKLSENYERINHAIFNNVRGTVSKKKRKKKKKKNGIKYPITLGEQYKKKKKKKKIL